MFHSSKISSIKRWVNTRLWWSNDLSLYIYIDLQ
jgi:hypothetical protein